MVRSIQRWGQGRSYAWDLGRDGLLDEEGGR